MSSLHAKETEPGPVLTRPEYEAALAGLDFRASCDSRTGCDREATWIVVNRCPCGLHGNRAFFACDTHAETFRRTLPRMGIHCEQHPDTVVPYADCVVSFRRIDDTDVFDFGETA